MVRILFCLLFGLIAYAQNLNKPSTKPPIAFDKSNGEEFQIKQREKWLQDSRGLYDVHRPDLLRKAAAEQTDQMRRMEARRPRRAGWTEIGPSPMTMLGWAMGNVAGRISAIAVHPTNRDILYIGAAGGGFWKTTNGGTSWTCLSNELGTQSIGSIWIDPNQPETVWLGTGEHASGCTGYFGIGLFKSTDGGSTLVPMNGQSGHSLDLSFIAGIAAHPSQTQTMLVGGHGFCVDGSRMAGGIYRTSDGGVNWDKVLTAEITDLLSDPNDPDIFYAAAGRGSALAENGIYKSTDAGQNWTRLSNGIDVGNAIGRLRLSMAPSDSQVLYAYSSAGKIFQTLNGGTSWTQTGSNACEGQCTYNLCIAVNPTTPTTLLVGSIRFSLSTNGGANRTSLTSGWGSNQKVHQDTHVLVYDRSDPNKFWVGSDGGIWRSDDGGSNFVNLNANLNITQFYDIAVTPGAPHRVFGGAQDNSSLGTDNQLIWDVNEVTGDGFMNLVDPLNTQIVYQTSYPSTNLPSILRSDTGGTPGSFQWLNTTGITSGPFPWVTPLEITANQAQTQSYVFVASNRVYMSSNNGESWTALSAAPLMNSAFNVIEATPTNSGITLYAGGSNGQIFRTDNCLANPPVWTNVTGNFPAANVTDIAIDSANPLRVFATRGAFDQAKIYRSTNGGTTWTALGTGLPNTPATTVAIDSIDPNRIFVGTDVGVFESTDGGENFVTMMMGMPTGNIITDLEISASPHLLSAGTYGRGAWQISLELADLVLETGPDRVLCLGEEAKLSGVASNGAAPLTYLWRVESGPDTSLSQFDDVTLAAPVFTASTAGTYSLSCQVTDSLMRTTTDGLELYASTVEIYTAGQRLDWSKTSSSGDYEPRYDRNSNNAIEILDILMQMETPSCY